jgi:threonyl-tRNA synthetase
VQVALLPVADIHEEYAAQVSMEMMKHGLRLQYMNSEDSLGKRIREGEQQRIPYILVVGDREKNESTVTVRNTQTKQQVALPLQEFIAKTASDIAGRKLKASIG